MDNKITLNLVSAGVYKQIKKGKIAINKAEQCIKIISYISKQLGKNSNDIFLYQKEFAIFPDTYIGDLCNHIPNFDPKSMVIDVNYGSRNSYG